MLKRELPIGSQNPEKPVSIISALETIARAGSVYYIRRSDVNSSMAQRLALLIEQGYIKNLLKGPPDTGNVAYMLTDKGSAYIRKHQKEKTQAEEQSLASAFWKIAGEHPAGTQGFHFASDFITSPIPPKKPIEILEWAVANDLAEKDEQGNYRLKHHRPIKPDTVG